MYPLTVPPLRQRPEDILLLAGYFIEQTRRKLGVRQLKLSPAAAQALQSAAWPGNVRELEHVVSRAALKASGRDGRHGILTMQASDLALTAAAAAQASPVEKSMPLPSADLKTATEVFQRQLIQQTLAQTNCNWAEAARRLQLDRANLQRLAKRLGMKVGRIIQTEPGAAAPE